MDGAVHLALLFGTCADQLAGRKEQYDRLWVKHPVDEARELLRLVHASWEHPCRQLEVDLAAEAIEE